MTDDPRFWKNKRMEAPPPVEITAEELEKSFKREMYRDKRERSLFLKKLGKPMGTDIYINGFVPANETWKKNLDVWNACKAAGIDVPEQVQEFFGWEDPTSKPGMEIDISGAYTEINEEYKEGFLIEIDKIPSRVKFIKCYMG